MVERPVTEHSPPESREALLLRVVSFGLYSAQQQLLFRVCVSYLCSLYATTILFFGCGFFTTRPQRITPFTYMCTCLCTLDM